MDLLSTSQLFQDFLAQRRYLRNVTASTNNRPPIADRSEGMWRRMCYLQHRMTVPVERQDARLAEKLKGELPGTLNWALEGRERLYRMKRFTEPSSPAWRSWNTAARAIRRGRF